VPVFKHSRRLLFSIVDSDWVERGRSLQWSN
jgi:hypothetical protein